VRITQETITKLCR